ncbi:MAG: hypothetical protein PVI75_03280 [Gammaproteobacteria bacterium]
MQAAKMNVELLQVRFGVERSKLLMMVFDYASKQYSNFLFIKKS